MADDGWQVPLRQRRQPLTTELSSEITYAEISHGLEIVQRIDIGKKACRCNESVHSNLLTAYLTYLSTILINPRRRTSLEGWLFHTCPLNSIYKQADYPVGFRVFFSSFA